MVKSPPCATNPLPCVKLPPSKHKKERDLATKAKCFAAAVALYWGCVTSRGGTSMESEGGGDISLGGGNS